MVSPRAVSWSNKHSAATNSHFKIIQILYLYFLEKEQEREEEIEEKRIEDDY